MVRKAATTKVAPVSSSKKYWKTYLTQVIARIDFAEPLTLPKKGPSERIVNALKKEFPLPELKVTRMKEVEIGLTGHPQQTFKEIKEWNYHGKKRNKRIVITSDCLVLEYAKYNNFEVLQSDFITAVNALFADFKDLQVRRFGVRYINKIDLNNEPNLTEWEKYLDKNLLTTLNLVEDPSTLVRALHVLEQKFDDESRLRFQFGMPNPDYPASVHRKVFLLDTDVYRDLLMTQDEIKQDIVTFHDRCNDRFERAITDQLREKMKGK
jgi:uncharacterized protein (TIGR04255 family)